MSVQPAGLPDKPKLIIIGPTPPPFHGVSVAIETLLKSRLTDAFDVTHLELADRRGIAHVNKPDWYDVALFIRQWLHLWRLLLVRRPQIVYLVLSQTTVGFIRDSLLIWPSLLLGGEIVAHLHGGAMREWYESRWPPMRGYIRAVLGAVAKIIVLGESLRPICSGLLPDDRIVVVPNGVDLREDEPEPKPLKGARPWRILHLNTLNRMKGTLVLLEAIPVVLTRRRDVRFVLAGPWSHEDHRIEAEQYVAQHRLEDFVTSTGQVAGQEKWELFRSADLFVFPGVQQEGQPLVVLEAMAAGLPVLFTNQGCLRETVANGEAGLEVGTNNPHDLAARILWLLDQPQERRRMGENARRRCRTLFSRDRHIERMIEVLGEAAIESSVVRPSPFVSTHHGSPHT